VPIHRPVSSSNFPEFQRSISVRSARLAPVSHLAFGPRSFAFWRASKSYPECSIEGFEVLREKKGSIGCEGRRRAAMLLNLAMKNPENGVFCD
jgi:hypothetical protein